MGRQAAPDASGGEELALVASRDSTGKDSITSQSPLDSPENDTATLEAAAPPIGA
jgi:hypothetical protein